MVTQREILDKAHARVYPNAFPKKRFGMEEIVGPVLSMIPVETLDDAIHLLESSCCGSAVNILSEHGGWAREFRMRLNVDNAGIKVTQRS